MSIFWGYLRFKLAMFVLRLAGWALLLALLAAVLVAAAPITLVAAVGLAGGAAGVAAVPAMAGRRLVAGDDRCVPGRRGVPRDQLAGVRAGSGA